MFRFLMRLYLSILCVCLLGQTALAIEVDEVDSHLDSYSHLSISHHDNIDDDSHSHTHKHSKDGEEHEHHHKHCQLTQNLYKNIGHSYIGLHSFFEVEMKNGFYEKTLISIAHPYSIFRPPIS